MKYIFGQHFEAEILSWFWSWILVRILCLKIGRKYWSWILVKSSKLKFGHDFEADFWLSFWAQVWSRLWRWIFDKLAIWLKSNYFGESTFKWLKPLCQLCLFKCLHYEPELRFKGACLLQIRSFVIHRFLCYEWLDFVCLFAPKVKIN